jgi:hypothetical protein
MDIIDQLGGTAVVARLVGCRSPSVSEWRHKGVIPQDRCPLIERGTEGKFHCEVLNPEVPWLRVADPAWPWHPEGRPVIDVVNAASKDAPQEQAA